MKYPTWAHFPFAMPSLTQKDRHPVTCVLMTWITPSTPVLGSADESVEDAPTHHVELAVGAANDRTGGASSEVGAVVQTNSPPQRRKKSTAKHAAFIESVGLLCTLYTVRDVVSDPPTP